MALTKRSVDAAKAPKSGVAHIWDGSIPGFGLRVRASGRKTYVLRYRSKTTRRDRLLTLGDASALTVKQAQSLAVERRGEIAKGRDPVEEAREAGREDRAALRFKDLAESWLETYAKAGHRRSWPLDEQRLRDYVLPRIGRKRVDSLTRKDVNAIHQAVAKCSGRVVANRVVRLIGSIYGWASNEEHIPGSVANPARNVKLFEEKPRIRLVRGDEWANLLRAIHAYDNPIVAGAILVLLFTGLRKKDVLNLRWADVDLTARRIVLASQKTDQPRMVAMSEPTRLVLEAMPRFFGNPHVFPGRVPGEPLKDIKAGWTRIREAAGCPDLRIHDFRRTIGTMLALQGEHPSLIAQVLGHRSDEMAKVYVAIASEMTSGAMDRLGQSIVEAAGPVEIPSQATTDGKPGKPDPDNPARLHYAFTRRRKLASKAGREGGTRSGQVRRGSRDRRAR